MINFWSTYFLLLNSEAVTAIATEMTTASITEGLVTVAITKQTIEEIAVATQCD